GCANTCRVPTTRIPSSGPKAGTMHGVGGRSRCLIQSGIVLFNSSIRSSDLMSRGSCAMFGLPLTCPFDAKVHYAVNTSLAAVLAFAQWCHRRDPMASASALRQHKDALLGEQICQAPVRIEGIRPAVAVQGEAALDTHADLVAHRNEVADRAEMD